MTFHVQRGGPLPRCLAGLATAFVLALPGAAASQTPAPAVLPPIAPGDSALPATVERLFVVAEMEQLYNQSLETNMAAQIRAQPALVQFEDILRSFMQRHASWHLLKPDIARIYRETYTEADMQELIRFYETDFGQRLMASMPIVMARSTEVSMQRVQAALPELIEEVQARMASPGGAPEPE